MRNSLLFALGLSIASGAAAARSGTWEVSVTNTTPGQSFTPLVAITHSRNYSMFQLGEAANEALEAMAEGGDTSGIADNAERFASDMQNHDALLEPGQTVTFTLRGDVGRSRLSIAGMLLPTNDSFVAVNGASLPRFGTETHMVPAYDAGTEMNDQSCQHIPGPRCGGEAVSAESGEGIVHIGNGFHDLGSEDAEGFEVLGPMIYDWRNPVARVTVQRVR